MDIHASAPASTRRAFKRNLPLELRHPFDKYCLQNYHSQSKVDKNQQRVDFRLTFGEWWALWHESGKWSSRGCKTGQYVMCRYDDAGHYEVGNVFIATTDDNHREANRRLFVQRPNGELFNIQLKATCPHCGKNGNKVAMMRWHFDNCPTLLGQGFFLAMP
jgi:hypothetical protein